MTFLHRLSNHLRRFLQLTLVYGVLFAIALLAAAELRDQFSLSDHSFEILAETLWWLAPIKFVSMYAFGQYRGLLSYFRLPDVYRLALAMGLPTGVFLAASFLSPYGLLASKSAVLLDYFFSLSLLCLFRTGLRIYRERGSGKAALGAAPSRETIAIYGAGQTGSELAGHLMAKRGRRLRPVAFLDDDPAKWRKLVHGIKVYRSISDMRASRLGREVGKIVVAMPGASATRVREIAEEATQTQLKVEIVPSLEELVSGRKQVDRIRPVQIEDLLGRDPVKLRNQSVMRMIRGRTVMVTGAGGTIGSELCRQIAQCEPGLLLLVERAEYLLFQTEQKIRQSFPDVPAHAFIGDVTDAARMDFLMEGFLPNVVFHAAAHKHVPMMEHQPGEAIRNNTLGTVALADLAIKHEVDRFVLISSDKAVNPTNVMGVSKRMAEIFLQSLQASAKSTQFVAVRFGNVLGSSGSVIPTFRRQIAEGGPVTVTHPEITRYFMTVSEAVGLVLDCSTDAQGGEIFVLDMGKPVKIYDLAKEMIFLSGLKLGADIEIAFTGLRPGEKLYEELQHDQETLELTGHEKVFRFKGRRSKESEVRKFLEELAPMLGGSDYNALKRKIKEFVPEYRPDFSAPIWASAHGEVAAAYRKEGGQLILDAEGKLVAFDNQSA